MSELLEELKKVVQFVQPIRAIAQGKVVKATNGSPNLATVDVQSIGEQVEDVLWLDPVLPRVGSLCLVAWRDNLDSRPVAFSFEQIDELDMTVGTGPTAVHLTAKQGLAKLECGSATVSTDGTAIKAESGVAKVSADPASGWVFEGAVQFKDNVQMDGKLGVDGETTIEGIKFMQHGHPYTDTPGGPATSQGPVALG